VEEPRPLLAGGDAPFEAPGDLFLFTGACTPSGVREAGTPLVARAPAPLAECVAAATALGGAASDAPLGAEVPPALLGALTASP
jgi:hypothetical protein